MNTNIKPRPDELPEQSAVLLKEVLTNVLFDPATRPREFVIKLYAENLLRLAHDIIFLTSNDNTGAAPVIARAILESLFKVGVAAKDPDLATKWTILEIEWDDIQMVIPGSNPRDLPKIRQMQEYAAIGERIENLSKRWGFEKEDYTTWKSPNTWKWAQEAGFGFLYKGRYAELSTYAHGICTSFFAPSVPSYALAVVTLCLIEASNRIAERFKSDVPQDLKDQISKLEKTYRSYHESGKYGQLFAGEMLAPFRAPGVRANGVEC